MLIVEDDRMTGIVLSQYLEAHGYRTTVATNGADGLSKFLSEEPDLALVDVLLPRKNGFEVCFEMKHTEHGRSTPVVMMSAVYRNTHSAEARAHGVKADGFLLKPFDLDEMVSRVNDLIGGP